MKTAELPDTTKPIPPRPRNVTNLTLGIGTLLCHFSIPHAENIAGANVSARAILLNPPIAPANHAAISTREAILSFEHGLGRRGKETLPEGADCGLSLITLAIWRRVCILEHTILGHDRHDSVHVMPIEGVVEPLNRFKCVIGQPIFVRIVSHRAVPPFSSSSLAPSHTLGRL